MHASMLRACVCSRGVGLLFLAHVPVSSQPRAQQCFATFDDHVENADISHHICLEGCKPGAQQQLQKKIPRTSASMPLAYCEMLLFRACFCERAFASRGNASHATRTRIIPLEPLKESLPATAASAARKGYIPHSVPESACTAVCAFVHSRSGSRMLRYLYLCLRWTGEKASSPRDCCLHVKLCPYVDVLVASMSSILQSTARRKMAIEQHLMSRH